MNVPSELRQLEEKIGSFIEFWGFQKIHGRIWTHLFLAEAAISETELAERLGVSVEELTSLVPELIDLGVIVREEGKGFSTHSDLTTVIINVLRRRELPMLRETRNLCESLQSYDDQAGEGMISRKKIAKLRDTAHSAETLLAAFLKLTAVKEQLQFANPFRSGNSRKTP